MKFFVICILVFIAVCPGSAQEKLMKEIRTYMSFNFPVEPAKIVIIPDMDLSYALASRLIEWSPSKQLAAGLATKWETPSEKVYRFTLRESTKWSDGSPVLSSDIKKSLERNLKKYPDDLRSLANLVERFECPSPNVIEFHLKVLAKQSGLLGKLTEPNFGITKINANGALDLSVTTGAFALEVGSDKELKLKRNPHWYHFSEAMAERVVIRRPDPSVPSQSVLLTDSWPNMIETSSLLSGDALQKYGKEGFQVWRRPIDKVFVLELSKENRNASGYALLRGLRQKLDRSKVTQELTGFTPTEQLFPKGFQLHNLAFQCKADNLSESAARRKLNVLISPARVSPQLRENLERALTAA
ncbi:MAG: hypothetical protein K2X47_03535, partial [Bdellovibrionales bacterium]|nr:hypothetical protein [Bdellovibrionales bacterium]